MRTAIALLAGPTVLLALLGGCGSDDELVPVALPTASADQCRAATVKILQFREGTLSPTMDTAGVHSSVGNGSPACIAFDRATLDSIYAEAATDYLQTLTGDGDEGSPAPDPSPDPSAQAAAASGLSSDAEAEAADADADAADAEAAERAREATCRAAARRVATAGAAAAKRGKDRAAAEGKVLDSYAGTKPCGGIPEDVKTRIIDEVYDEVDGR